MTLLCDDEPVLMGIVNVTTDSFTDGGLYLDPDKAIAHGLRLRAEGAAILDIGGESTRPGAVPVSAEEEMARVIPVIRGLKECGAVLSIDTRHAATMRAAIEAGAGMVNDISALEFDPDSLDVVAKAGVYVSLMHMKGAPKTMQDNPQYEDVVREVYEYLERRIETCTAAGIRKDRIIVDVGIGFGKTLEHNVTLLKNIGFFASLGVPVLLGTSRKRFIEGLAGKAAGDERLGGSVASCLAAYAKGVRLFRVHDVRDTAQALKVFQTVR